MLTLNFANQALGAVSSLECTREGDRENWQLTLEVQAATPALLEQALAEMRALIGTAADVALQAGGATVRELAVVDCRHGPTLARVHELDSAPGQVHGKRKLRLHFEATRQDAAQAVQSQTETLTLVSKAGAAHRLLTRGEMILRSGEDPAAHESGMPASPPGFRRVASKLTRDAAVPSLAYEMDDEQVFSPLPAGVDDGHYVISEARDAEGRVTRSLTGFFVGPGALAQANALAPDGAERVIRTNAFTRRVEFEFREVVPDADGLVASVETLSFMTTRRVVDHPLLAAGAPAYRQEIGAAQTEIIQQGRATGDGRHAAPPPPRYFADLVERAVRYSVPHPGLPADRRWVTAWRYVSRTRAAVPAKQPETA